MLFEKNEIIKMEGKVGKIAIADEKLCAFVPQIVDEDFYNDKTYDYEDVRVYPNTEDKKELMDFERLKKLEDEQTE